MRLLDLAKGAKRLYESRTSIHLIGPPGVGKSDTIKNEFRQSLEAAYGTEFGYHDVLLPTIDAPDIRGFLIPTKTKAGEPTSFFTRSAILPDEEYLRKYPRGVMLLDERNAADLLTQKAVAPAVLSKRFGEHYLPEGWLVVSASNRLSDRAGVIRPPSHLRNRERTINIDADITSWAVWAEKTQVHPMVIAWAKQKPGVALSSEVPKHDDPFCTARSLTSAARLLALGAGKDDQGRVSMELPSDSLTMAFVAGDIGEAATAELAAFLKLHDQLPTIEEIEANPAEAKCPQQLSAAWAAMQMCLHFVTGHNVDKLWTYMMRFPRELQVSAAKSMIERSGGVLLNSKSLSTWIGKNAALINASN